MAAITTGNISTKQDTITTCSWFLRDAYASSISGRRLIRVRKQLIVAEIYRTASLRPQSAPATYSGPSGGSVLPSSPSVALKSVVRLILIALPQFVVRWLHARCGRGKHSRLPNAEPRHGRRVYLRHVWSNRRQLRDAGPLKASFLRSGQRHR